MGAPTARAGRPTEVDQSDLLDAGERLFAEHGFEGTTVRAVARNAACNPALISYYFGGKEGLYQSVLLRHFQRVRSLYASADFSAVTLAKAWPELRDADQRTFCATMFQMLQPVVSNTRMQKILTRELMSGGTQMISPLCKSEGGLVKALRERVVLLQKQGRIRRECEPALCVLSLIGPVLYSLMSAPLIKSAYGLGSIDEPFLRTLCIHQTRTFFEGWGVS